MSRRQMSRAEYRRLRRIASEALNTPYVGHHWPCMEELRVDGFGIGFNERRSHEARIRRFVSTFSPDYVLEILDAVEPVQHTEEEV